MTSDAPTTTCPFNSSNLNFLFRRFVQQEDTPNWEVYFFDDNTRSTLLSPGEYEMEMTDDAGMFSIGLIPLGPNLGRVETRGWA
jgi:hypothetical protein